VNIVRSVWGESVPTYDGYAKVSGLSR